MQRLLKILKLGRQMMRTLDFIELNHCNDGAIFDKIVSKKNKEAVPEVESACPDFLHH